MNAPITPVEPKLGMHRRYAAQFKKGAEWAAARFSDLPPDDRQAGEIAALIESGASWPIVKRRLMGGNVTDGPSQYRQARRLDGIARRHMAAPTDSLDRTFWSGVLAQVNEVMRWWSEHSELMEQRHEEVKEDLFDKFAARGG